MLDTKDRYQFMLPSLALNRVQPMYNRLRGLNRPDLIGKKKRFIAENLIDMIRNQLGESVVESLPPLTNKNVLIIIDRAFQLLSAQPVTKKKNTKSAYKQQADAFYSSLEWRKLRYLTLKKYGKKCMLCNAVNTVLHVDHIKPLSKFWELRLDPNNLQVLCEDCNKGKGNWDETDFRPG